MLWHPVHAFHNVLDLFDAGKFRIVSGTFGLKLVVGTKWSEQHSKYLIRHQIKEVGIVDVAIGDWTEDLEFLLDLLFLEALSVACYKVKDFSPIGHLKKLRSLSLPIGAKGGLGFQLSSLSLLECLYLGERIPNEEEIFSCVGLKRLGLTKYPAKESSEPFANLKKLEYLSIAASGLSELDGLSGLQHLEEVSFALMKHLVSLRGLEGSAPNLKKVWIEGCPGVSDMSPLRNATNLEELYLFDCGDIESLLPLANMKRLKMLVVGGDTNIRDGNLDFLRHLPLLKDFRGVYRKHYSLSQDEFNRLKGRG
ncbi:MAG: hypothetical protein Q8R67_04150 [Rhodoferax sp.]|nr:hypothetical protein [Rhodoferax sp.]MDP3650857.1 hypothetical protein [Rhodoferax sp.]